MKQPHPRCNTAWPLAQGITPRPAPPSTKSAVPLGTPHAVPSPNQQMGRRRYAWIAAGVLLYSGLAVAVLVRLPIIDRGFEVLPGWLKTFVLTVAGPGLILSFSPGAEAWPVVVVALTLVATCLALARVAWRRSPESEWFAVWLICAAVIWGGSPWLLGIIMGI